MIVGPRRATSRPVRDLHWFGFAFDFVASAVHEWHRLASVCAQDPVSRMVSPVVW